MMGFFVAPESFSMGQEKTSLGVQYAADPTLSGEAAFEQRFLMEVKLRQIATPSLIIQINNPLDLI